MSVLELPAGLTRVIVPALDPEPWPTLGPEVCDWIEANLVHGPGDVLGDPIVLTDEERAILYRAYEVYPRGHELAGRRRFKRVVLTRRKGWRKTELAAWLAIAECDPTAPVRCDGWATYRGELVPVGRPVRDPYIPLVAVTEEQTEDLAFGTCREVLLHAELGNAYDVGVHRIEPRDAPGRMQAMASAPSARDGARTTFQHFDETHLFASQRLRAAHATMLRNMAKRMLADPWSLETTTAYEPGEESVAEESHRYAVAILEGQADDPRLYFDHLQADVRRTLRDRDELVAAIVEASGDAVEWLDLEAVLGQWAEAEAKGDESAFRRYWLNQPTRSSRRWAPSRLWLDLPAADPPEGDEVPVVLAFDGSYSRDSTALVGCTIEARPRVFVVGHWENPRPDDRTWRVPVLDVKAAVADALELYDVVEFAPDPPGWRSEVEEWEQDYGSVVVRFDTNQPSRMGPASDAFEQQVADGPLAHDHHPALARHLANVVPRRRGAYTLPTKESSDSPSKIDLAVGAVIAVHRALWHLAQADEDGDAVGAIVV